MSLWFHTLEVDVPAGPQLHSRVSYSRFGNVHKDSDTKV